MSTPTETPEQIAERIVDEWLKSTPFKGQTIVTSLAAAIQAERDRAEQMIDDATIGSFQDDVRKLVLEKSGAPTNAIDGKGSDAGWEDFTLCEISQGFDHLRERAEKAEAALAKINVIRNSIVAFQSVNFSEHVYPLVAALNEAGLEGMHYPEALAYFGPMLERTNAAEARAEQAERELEATRNTLVCELEATRKAERELADWKACAECYKTARDAAVAELAEAEKVIEPFAFIAAELEKVGHADESTCLWKIKSGDIRAAKQWLERRRAAK